MAFWTTQRIESEQERQHLIAQESYNKNRIKQGAYELSLSRDVIVTPDPESFAEKALGILKSAYPRPADDIIQEQTNSGTITIPPGQFVIAYTAEQVRIPANVLSFISVKAKIKLKGLVNISGFHVDPGYVGRLKFSLYNAGNRPICLAFGEPYFLIWFADMDDRTRDPYGKGNFHANQNGVSTDDREQMAEAAHSPAALAKRLDHLERNVKAFGIIASTILVAIIIPIFLSVANISITRWFEPTQSAIQNNTSAIGSTNSASHGR